MRKIILVALFVLSSIAAQAQTTATVQWNQSETPGVASSFNYTLKVDTATPVVLQPNCTLINAITTCSAALSNYIPGPHTFIITASNSAGSASATFTTGAVLPPTAPTAGKIIVIIIGNNNELEEN